LRYVNQYNFFHSFKFFLGRGRKTATVRTPTKKMTSIDCASQSEQASNRPPVEEVHIILFFSFYLCLINTIFFHSFNIYIYIYIFLCILGRGRKTTAIRTLTKQRTSTTSAYPSEQPTTNRGGTQDSTLLILFMFSLFV
jgi:hypothetical protein